MITASRAVGGWLTLAGAVAVQLAMGSLYAWSALGAELQGRYGMSASQASSILGVAIATFTLVMIPAGRGVARLGPRPMAVGGALLFTAGYLISSFAQGAFPLLVAGAGLLVGTGIGLAYTAPITACLAWFPQRKGLVTGVAVAGFGGGALLLSSGIEFLLERDWDPHEILRAIAICNGTLALLGASFLVMPKKSERDTGDDHDAVNLSLQTLSRTPLFWALVAGMMAATFGGLLAIGNLKAIGISFGVPAAAAGSAVGLFAVGNALGRLVWGSLYDRIGKWTLPLALVIEAALLALLIFARTPYLFILTAAALGFLFGSAFVLYAAEIATEWGSRAVAVVYPWVFLAYGFSGFAGPWLGGLIFDLTRSYVPACVVASLVSLAGCAILLALRAEMRRELFSCAGARLPETE